MISIYSVLDVRIWKQFYVWSNCFVCVWIEAHTSESWKVTNKSLYTFVKLCLCLWIISYAFPTLLSHISLHILNSAFRACDPSDCSALDFTLFVQISPLHSGFSGQFSLGPPLCSQQPATSCVLHVFGQTLPTLAQNPVDLTTVLYIFRCQSHLARSVQCYCSLHVKMCVNDYVARQPGVPQ